MMTTKDWAAKFDLEFATKLDRPTYCWVDVETTGLDVFKDDILEVGIVITNGFGEVIADSLHHTLVYPATNSWAVLPPEVLKIHLESGLRQDWLDDFNRGSIYSTYEQVDFELLDHVERFAPKAKLIWAGANVGSFDKLMIMRTMPRFADFLHYRTVDVSSLKEMVRNTNPMVFDSYAAKLPVKGHRPPLCLGESIKEYNYWLEEYTMPDWDLIND